MLRTLRSRAPARDPQQHNRPFQPQQAVAGHLFAPLSIAPARRRAGLLPKIGGGGGQSLGGEARQLLLNPSSVVCSSGFFFGGRSAEARTEEEVQQEKTADDAASTTTSSIDAEAAADQSAGAAAGVVGADADADAADAEDEEARALALEDAAAASAADDEEEQQQQQQNQNDDNAEESDDDEVLAVVIAAARAAGRVPGAAERALAQRLRDNWYSTARDVAALSAQELAALGAPLRVRAAAAAAVAEAEAAADALSGAAAVTAESGGDGTSNQTPSAAALLELDPDIMKRRAPLRRRPFKRGSVRVTRKAPGASWVGGGAEGDSGASPSSSSSSSSSSPQPTPPPSRHSYGLLESEMHADLAAEFQRLERFCTERTLGRRRPPVSRATHQGTVRYLRLLLGWLARVKKAAPSPGAITTLRQAFPSREREGAALLFEFRDFLERERGANARTVFNAMMSAAHAVRFLWGEEGEAPFAAAAEGGEGEGGDVNNAKNSGSDPPVLLEVRAMAGTAFKQTRRCPLVADESKKWLTWAEYARLVAELRLECAGLTPSGNARSPREVAACLQRYLIFAFLSCIPDRQRTLRELRVGHTLVKEPIVVAGSGGGGGGGSAGAGESGGDGSGSANADNASPSYRWVVRHGPGDYKTGRLYGPRPPLVVAPFLYPELEAYISDWRRHLRPGHDFLFTTVSSKGGGRPLTASSLYKLFSHTALVMTGRPMNPHLMRDLVVTHLRAQGTNEPEMEALAIYMGHSVQQQRATYDRRTRAQKAAPAVELMGRLVGGGGQGGGSGGSGGGGGGGGGGVGGGFGGVGEMFSDGLKL